MCKKKLSIFFIPTKWFDYPSNIFYIKEIIYIEWEIIFSIYRPPLELGQSLVLVKFKIIILCNIYNRYLNTHGKNEFFTLKER